MLTALLLALTLGQDPGPVLFSADTPITLRIEADFETVRSDRRGDPDEVPARLVLLGTNGDVVVEGEVRARGNFRRENCRFPPIRLDVKARTAEGTPFQAQDDLKLVVPCRPESASYRSFVLEEYLLYRIYALVSERSFQVRLAEITFADEKVAGSGGGPGDEEDAASGSADRAAPPDGTGDPDAFTAWAFFIEDDEALAERLHAEVFELPEGKNIRYGMLDPVAATSAAVFMYMIGNADWSDAASHNVELLLLAPGRIVPVPYDFDMAGVIDTPYATVNPDLGLRSVRERVYRGWCQSDLVQRSVLERFRSIQPDVEMLYEGFEWIDDDRRGHALDYLEDFFDDIETDDRADHRVFRGCRQPGQE